MFVRPNWRDPEQYKQLLQSKAYSFIAWEFLRRNPDYAADLQRLKCEIVQRGIGRDVEPSQDQMESLSESLKLNQALAEVGAKEPKFCREWRQHFIDSWQLNIPMCCKDLNGREMFVYSEIDLPGLFKEPPAFGGCISTPYLLIPVDLSMPLEILEERLLLRVRDFRNQGIESGAFEARKTRVLAPRVYVEQLRILDGFASGATAREIGQLLHPSAVNEDNSLQRDKRVKAAHDAALRMQNGGYRTLI